MVLFGPPGAGKTTIGKSVRTATEADVMHIGDILRDLWREGLLSAEDGAALEEGEPLSCAALEMGFARHNTTTQRPASNFLVLEGPPRSLTQAAFLRERLAPATIVHIDVPDVVVLQRLAARREVLLRPDDVEQRAARRLANFRALERGMLAAMNGARIVPCDGLATPSAIARFIASACSLPARSAPGVRNAGEEQ
jgi:adenylate kinase